MSSYIRNWFNHVPSFELSVSENLGPHVENEMSPSIDDDEPPAFPALNSAQRASASVPNVLTDAERMPPPPLPSIARRTPGFAPDSSSALFASPGKQTSKSASLAPNATTTRPTLPPKKRAKVALAPGHSPLDWAALKSSGLNLRGVETLSRISISVLKLHNKRTDAWTVIDGRVYNITPYLDFHPGGVPELMRVAGRDGTKLFASTHAWVNAEFMLDSCMVGFFDASA